MFLVCAVVEVAVPSEPVPVASARSSNWLLTAELVVDGAS
jgi:hypothetical protein